MQLKMRGKRFIDSRWIKSSKINAQRSSSIFGMMIMVSVFCLCPTNLFSAKPNQDMSSKEISESEVRDMVQSIGDQIITLIKDNSLSQQKKEDRFREILKKYFSLHNIARFVLGKYWRQATEEERKQYNELFANVVIENYVSQFGDYTDESLKVARSRSSATGGILVYTQIHRTDREPIEVDWLIRQTKTGPKVFDILVAGVSLSITQRSEYATIIQKHGGKIQGLLDEMRRQIVEANALQSKSYAAPAA